MFFGAFCACDRYQNRNNQTGVFPSAGLSRYHAFVFVNERGQLFGRMGISWMIERSGEAANLPLPVHVHMLRHSTSYALAGRDMDTRRLQHSLGHASITRPETVCLLMNHRGRPAHRGARYRTKK